MYPTNTTPSDRRRRFTLAGAGLLAAAVLIVGCATAATQDSDDNPSVTASQSQDLIAFAGLYVLVTATIGIVLMKESKRLGRTLFPAPRLTGET